MSLAGTCGSSRAPMQKKDAASPSSAANACAASFRLPWIMTFAPSRAKTLTMPSPIPVVEPVTRITLFFRRILALGGSWLENSFDDYAGMHLLKRFVPLVERGDAIEYRTEIDLATRQQGNDFLPDGPVVRKAALQCGRFLDQWIERKIERLWSPPNFGDLSCGTHNIERQFQRRGNAGSIDDQVETIAVAEIPDPLGNIFALRAQNRICPDSFRDIEALGVDGNADDDEVSGPGELGHHRAQQSDRPWSNHCDRIPWPQPGIDAHCVVGNAAWLGERRLLQGQRGRNPVQAARRHSDKGRHCPIDAVSETEPLRIQVVKSLTNKRRVGRQQRGSFAHHAVTLFKAVYAVAGLGNVTSEFMPEDDGVIDRPTLLAGVLMEIAAADAHGLHLKENVFFTNFWNREFAKLDRVRILCVIDQTDHSDPFSVIGNAKSKAGKIPSCS